MLSTHEETAFHEGQARWPGTQLQREAFAAWLRGTGVRDDDLAARGTDLFLACGCAMRDAVAVRHLDRELLAQIPLFVSRTGVPAQLLDEVKQKVRLKLLMGASPGIARYRGTGPLGAWVRVTAVRVAVDVAGKAAEQERPGDLGLLELCAPTSDESPDVQTARRLYREQFERALADSLAALEPRERTLLRIHFVDGLSLDALAAIYRVHRATIARWLVAIRTRAYKGVAERLALQLGSSASEVRSLVGLLGEEIRVSARRLLAD